MHKFYVAVSLMYALLSDEGNTSLEWVEIGHVLKLNNHTEYTFHYVETEKLDSVWPGMYTKLNVLLFKHIIQAFN